MKPFRWIAVLGVLYACSGEPQRIPPRVQLASIEIETVESMVVVGREVTLAATALYDDGTSKTVTTDAKWTVDDPSLGEVIRAGVIDTRAVGTLEVRATFEDVTGALAIVIIPTPIRSIAVTPASARIEVIERQQFLAVATFRDGTTMDVTAVLPWTSSDESIATVSAGLAIGVGQGRADISITDPVTTAKGTGILTVETPTIENVTIMPRSATLAIGRTFNLIAIADLSNGETRDATDEVEWFSNQETIVTVGTAPMNAGVVTGISAGTTEVVARHTRSNSRSTAMVTVTPAVVESISVTPLMALVGLGDTLFLSAVATLSDGTSLDVTNAVDWISSAPRVATVSNQPLEQGTVTTVSTGTTSISAYDPVSGVASGVATSAVITVTPATLRRIEVLPRTAQVAAGLTQQFTARGVFSDNSTRDFTPMVTWATAPSGFAAVDSAGLVTGLAAGNVTVSATDPVSQMASGANSAMLEVLPPQLISIGVSPRRQVVVEGLTQQLTATGRYSDGMDRDLSTTVRWLANANTVSVSRTGLVTGLSSGTATVSATDISTQISSNTTNENAVLSVEPLRLVAIDVAPPATALPLGATVPLTASGSYNDGSTADLTDVVVWSSSQPGTAQVGTTGNQRGLATAVGGGAAQIDALEPVSGVRATTSGTPAGINVLTTVTLSSLTIIPETSVVNLNAQRQFEALGRFSNGAQHLMTDAVSWSSSNTSVASVSNTAGSRGVVSGLVVGTASISVTHGPTNITSTMPGSVTVQVGTIGRSWNGPTVSVDATAQYGRNVGGVTFTTADFPMGSSIVDVDVSINFLKTDGSCALPRTGSAYHNETSFRIQSGAGVQVPLASTGTWSGQTAISPVTVTFDQAAAAAPSGIPQSGTFRPNGGNLNSLDTTSPLGTWILQAGDSAGGDPLCVIGYTVTVTAQ